MHACINIKGEFYTPDELYALGLASFGKDVRISKQAVITHPEIVTIGDHVAIDPVVYISTKLDIGDYVHIAPFVGIGGSKKSYCKISSFCTIAQGSKLICASEEYGGDGLLGPPIPEKYRVFIHGKIILEKFVALSVNSVVFPNVIIGEGTVVGTFSLVIHDLKPWSFYYGIPVKRIKDRDKEKILKYAEELQNHVKT